MNKTVNINLGDIPFSIDENAYERLSKYLKTIERHFSKSEGCEEIIYDIEVRMAELFQESLKNKQIVSLKEVEEVIAIMGTPQDFGAEEDEPKAESKHSQYTKTGKRYKTGKRLFRDPDEKVIAGVCGGLSTYFGFEDPIWMRLLFVLFFFVFGPLHYIIFWIVIPKARTTNDRLAMQGEAINVNNIARKVEEEISNITDKISDMASDIGRKKA